MVFSENSFLIVFLPLLLVIYHLPCFKSTKTKNIILLLFSLFFYTWGEPVFVFFLLIEIIINWLLGGIIDNAEGKKRKIYCIAAIVLDITVLVVFKYLGFILENVSLLVPKLDIPETTISLPVGISFFTFQIISYIIDLYRKEIKVSKSVWKLMLYVMMFPKLLQGPIVRYKLIEHEMDYREENEERWRKGFNRFAIGLGKKVLIANYLGMVVDSIFATATEMNLSVALAFYGSILYSLQIYFDFSGYSDMAIGLGLMFGFHFEENFNYPYMAMSITDFWRRWHISLSSWFRDYVYIPLGGNRCSKQLQIRNMFVVWLLTGIWHGANWTFIMWGLLYFLLLLMEKYLLKPGKQGGIYRLYTLFWINLAWVLFRSENVGLALQYIGNMFGVNANGLCDTLTCGYMYSSWGICTLAIIGVFPTYKVILKMFSEKAREYFENIYAVSILILCICMSISGQYNPFIYFNF